MKKIFSAALSTVIVNILFAQTGSSSNNFTYDNLTQYNNNITKIIPPSPEAASIAKYGGIPIGLNTGTFQYSIPIYTIQSGSLSHSISLNYSTNGIKVDEIASRIGLGWNLKAGGVITRKIMDKPDELSIRSFYTGNTTITTTNQDYYNFLMQSEYTGYDLQPDEYSFNFSGFSGKFIQRQDGTFTEYNATGMKIEKIQNSAGFVLTTIDGTKYFFAIAEETKTETLGDNSLVLTALPVNAPTAYYLTKIQALNGDEINFNYTSINNVKYNNGIAQNYSAIGLDGMSYYADPFGLGSGTPVAEPFQSLAPPSLPNGSVDPPPGIVTTIENSITHIKILSSIDFAGGRIVFELSDRDDVPLDKKIESIKVYRNADNYLIKQFKPNYVYSNALSSLFFDTYIVSDNYTDANPTLRKRLFLDHFDEISSDGLETLQHKFEYDDINNLPPRLSFSQDKFGLFNGKHNSMFFPNDTWFDYFIGDRNFGGDRSYNSEFAKKGTLKKIVYPTGGYTTIEYEPHQIDASKIEYASKVETSSISLTIDTSTGPHTYTSSSASPFVRTLNQKLYLKIKCDWATVPITVPSGGLAGFFQEDYHLSLSLINTNGVCVPIICQRNITPDVNEYEYKIDGANGYAAIPAGVYRLKLESFSPSLKATVTLIGRERVADNSINSGIAGVRVKKMVDFNNNNIEANRKEYLYTDWDNQSISTGQGINLNGSNNNYVSLEHYKKVIPNGISTTTGYLSYNTIHSSSVVQNYFPENGIVCYTKVIELNTSQTTKNNGCTEYEYFFEKKQLPKPSSDHLPTVPFGGCVADPSLSESEQLAAYEICMRLSGAQGQPFIPIGTPFINNDFLTGLQKSVKQYSYSTINGARTILSQIDNYYTLDMPITTIDTFFVPKKFKKPDILPHFTPPLLDFVDFYIGKYWRYFSFLKLDKTVSTNYSSTGNITNQVVNNYSRNNFRINQQDFTTSRGESKTIFTRYPKVYTNGSPLSQYNTLFAEMVSKNLIGIPIEEEVIKNNTSSDRLLLKRKVLSKWGTNNLILPNQSFSSTKTNSLEPDVTFQAYSDRGQLQQYTSRDGIINTFIYGYNSLYPVAKIVGSDYNTVINNLNQVQKDALNNATGTTLSDDANVRAILNTLRVALPSAIITTYTYSLLKGVTSETDPQGKTIYYVYDNFNRLKLIKDKDNNILKTFEYKYQEQQ